MQLFTRSMVALALLVLSLAPTLAANITILVGDNFYHGPNNTTLDHDIRTINVGDVVTWRNVGRSSHPTMSDNGAWATFPMAPGSPDFVRTFSVPGSYPYHCMAHGAPGQFQYGILTVTGTATATLDARAAGLELNVYPNPSRGQVTVQLKQQAGAGEYKLRLSNIIGQEVRTVLLKPELTAAGLPLDLSDLRSGVYFYSLLVDGKVTSTKRLVLQN